MTKVFKANMYFLTILILEIVAPYILRPIYATIGLTDARLFLFLNHIILFLVPSLIYLTITKSSFKETLRLNKLHWKDTLLIILLAFVVQPIMTFFSLISSFFFENEIGSFISQISATPYLILLCLVALLPAITEEVVIRGVVLSGYKNKNKYIAAAVTGLFFGILHLDGQQFLYATALGFIFALVVIITNSIYSSVIMHFIINGTSTTIVKVSKILSDKLGMPMETTELTLSNIPFTEKLLLIIVYGVIAVIFSIFVFLIIYALIKINKKRNTKEGNTIVSSFDKNEKIINIPFILIITIYIIAMIISI